jgi:MerR family transcriptional regulator, thiopeptide resistance regulator
MTSAHFRGLIAFCLDVPATAGLYQTVLGFRRGPDQDGDISMQAPVATNPAASIQIYLHPTEHPRPTTLGSFTVDDVDDVTGRLAAEGCTVTTPPADTPWGTREATVKDPNGHDITLAAPVKPS